MSGGLHVPTSGDQNNGACTYPADTGAACTDDTNPCTTDLCDSSAACVHAAGNAGTTCRFPAGACDTAELCTGIATACPNDSMAAAATVCRPVNGNCDVQETCSGSTVTCPFDGFLASTAVCRSSGGACDVQESCTGYSAACPGDVMQTSTYVCSPASCASTTLILAATCTGSAASCPSATIQACSTPPNTTGPTCSGAACGYTACQPGYADCDGTAASGCEVAILSNPQNCGTCNHSCFGGATSCASGVCQIVDVGWTISPVAGYDHLDASPDGLHLYLATQQGVKDSAIGTSLPSPTLVVAAPGTGGVGTNGTTVTWFLAGSGVGSHPSVATVGTWTPAALATPDSVGQIGAAAMFNDYVWWNDLGGNVLHRFAMTPQTDVTLTFPSYGALYDVAAAPDGTLYVGASSVNTDRVALFVVAPNATTGSLFWVGPDNLNGPIVGLAADATYVYGADVNSNVVKRIRRDNAAMAPIVGTQDANINGVAVTSDSLFFVTTTGQVLRLAK